jgi:hypothetical protein
VTVNTHIFFWTLLICRGDVGDRRKPYYGSYASELMSWKYNDMINTVMDSFGQLDCGYHAQQLSNIFIILQSPFLLDARKVPKSNMLNSQQQTTSVLLTLYTRPLNIFNIICFYLKILYKPTLTIFITFDLILKYIIEYKMYIDHILVNK